MTTNKDLRGISLYAPLALAILFGIAISASADDLPTASDSVKGDAKPADAAAVVPRRQDEDNSGSEFIEVVAGFIPRVGKCTYKVKRGWTGWLISEHQIQGTSWGIVDTHGIGVTSNRTEDKIMMFPSTDPVLDIVAIGEYCKFVAVRKGTATIRYVGQGKDGNVRCEMQIEVEADTTEIDAALKEAIPQSQIKVTEIRSIALLTGTVPTLDDLNQAKWIATQFYPDFMSQLKVATPSATSPAPESKPPRKPSPKTENSSPQKTKSGVRAELKELRSEVQALRQDIRELNALLAKRAEREAQPKLEPPMRKVPEGSEFLRNGILSFDATWCGPCQQMKPIVNRLKQGAHPIQSVDVDAHPELCKKFNVESIPSFVLVKDGREIERVSGITTEAKLKDLMKKVEIEPANQQVPLSLDELPRELSLTVGETKVLTFDHPVSILTSKPDLVVIERGSPKSARIRAKTTGEVELQLVYRDSNNTERIRVRVVDDHLMMALSKTIALNISNQPLTEILREFNRLVGANIHLDTKGLEDEGVSPETKQSIVVTDVSARTALKLILKPLHLDFIEDQEVIRVTSRARANGELFVVLYNVKDLVESEAGQKPTTTVPQLVELLQQVGDRDSWEAAGGAGSVRYHEETRGLVVRQTYSMHYQVSIFLEDLRRPKEKEIIRGQSIDSQASRFIEERLGVVLVPLTSAEASELPPSMGPDGKSTKWQGGLRVTEIKRPHLLRKKDVIVGINTSSVTTLAEITMALGRFEKSSTWPKDPLTGEPAWPTERGTITPPKGLKYSPQPQSTIKLQVVSDGQIQWLDFTLLNSKQHRDAAEFVTTVYSVADLVPPVPEQAGQESTKPRPDWFRLIDLIVADVEPTCWKLNGGDCSIVTSEQTLSLVIRAPQYIHDQVTTVLARERRKLDIQVSFSVRMIAAPERPLVDLTGFGLKTDPEAKCSLLNADQSKKVLDALQAGGAEVLYAPKITVFNGHTASLLSRAWPMKDGTVIDVAAQMRGFVAPDRRSVGVNLALNADKVVEELTRRTINVADGSSLLLDVTEELRTKNPDKSISGRAYMLVEPKVIVLEEEEERLDAPRKGRVSMETPRGILNEEEELRSPPQKDRVSMKTPIYDVSPQGDPWGKALQNPDPHDWERMPPPEFLDVDTYISDARTGRLMFGVGVNNNSGLVGNIRVPRGSVVEEE